MDSFQNCLKNSDKKKTKIDGNRKLKNVSIIISKFDA